ncbi:MAG: hypothetical protein SGBAC_011809, partial [Bacillariaceae sp.]
MKLYLSLFLVAVATVALPTTVDAASADTCAQQSVCVDFELKTLTSDDCGVEGRCPVEVCMIVDGDMTNEHGTCQKGSSSGFSHMCTQSDSTGCAVWEDDAQTIPLLGEGSSKDCALDGKGSGTPIFGDKCEGANEVRMCQEGKPGQTLYWILKDGNAPDEEDPNPQQFDFTWHTNGCEAEVHCFNYMHRCGGVREGTDPATDAQAQKE